MNLNQMLERDYDIVDVLKQHDLAHVPWAPGLDPDTDFDSTRPIIDIDEIVSCLIRDRLVTMGSDPIDYEGDRFTVTVQDVRTGSAKIIEKKLVLTYAHSLFGRDEAVRKPQQSIVLERFTGFVDRVDGDVAYVTIKSDHGETILGEYSASELAKLGIFERRRFECRTIQVDGSVRVDMNAIPDIPISWEENAAIDREIDDLLDGDDLDGDY